MNDKPSIVFVHGFWGGATHWAKVIVELNGRGYDSLHAVENPLTSLADDVERTRKMIKQDKFHESFCQDLPDGEALVMAVTQKAPIGSTFGEAVSDPAWKKKPTWYQVSSSDRMIHPNSQRRMAERMNPRRTIELDASHASLASQPSAIVDLIAEAVTDLGATGVGATMSAEAPA